MKQWLKDFVHNCVVHPAMPFLPVKVANWLHDKNANWAFGLERYDEVGLEQGLMTRKFDESQIANRLTGRDILEAINEQEAKDKEKKIDELKRLSALKPPPTLKQRIDAAVITGVLGGHSGIGTRLRLMYPYVEVDPAHCAKMSADILSIFLNTVALTVPPQAIEQIEQQIAELLSLEE